MRKYDCLDSLFSKCEVETLVADICIHTLVLASVGPFFIFGLV